MVLHNLFSTIKSGMYSNEKGNRIVILNKIICIYFFNTHSLRLFWEKKTCEHFWNTRGGGVSSMVGICWNMYEIHANTVLNAWPFVYRYLFGFFSHHLQVLPPSHHNYYAPPLPKCHFYYYNIRYYLLINLSRRNKMDITVTLCLSYLIYIIRCSGLCTNRDDVRNII